MYIRLSNLFVFLLFSVYQTLAKPRAGYCDGCVSYNFESDFEDLFTNEKCGNINGWKTAKYSDVDVERPNEYTETFITPDDDLSCSTSFPFSMTGGGTVQVNLFMNITNSSFNSEIYVFAEQISSNSSMGFGLYSPLDSSFVNGWNTLTFTLLGTDTVDGHLIFLGWRNQTSTVLVDSFCYKPASSDGDCWVDYASTTAQPEATTNSEIELTTSSEADSTSVPEIDSTTSNNDLPTTGNYPTTSIVTDSTSVPEIDSTTSNNDLPTTGNYPTTSIVTDSTSDPEIDSTTSNNDLPTTGNYPTTSIVTDSTSIPEIDSTTSNNYLSTTGNYPTMSIVTDFTLVPEIDSTTSNNDLPTTENDSTVTEINSTTSDIDATTAVVTDPTVTETDFTTPEITNPTSVTTISPTTVTDTTEQTDAVTTISPTISPTIVTEPTETVITTSPITVTEPTEAITTISPTTVTKPTEVVTSTTGLPTINVPEPTLPTQAPSNNQCHENPFIHWLVPHEYDCNLFYYCVWGEKVLRQCPAGLHFNPIIQVCDWPWNAGCTTQ